MCGDVRSQEFFVSLVILWKTNVGTRTPRGFRKMTKINVSGRNWKADKKKQPLKLKSWEEKQAERLHLQNVKLKEKELREEKEAKRQEQISRLRQRRENKAERERYEKLAEVMHRKRVDRLRRREKRNKLLKER